MKLNIVLILFGMIALSCNEPDKNLTDSQAIVDNAIQISGKDKLNHSTLKFSFRNVDYTSEGKCNYFVYERRFNRQDSLIRDSYNTQTGLKRYINDSIEPIADSTAFKYAESLNSINYFIQLPLRLNDEAVQKTYIGLDTIRGKAYHNLMVKFDENNGGTDFQDVYYYWFGKEDYKLDYLAYSFVVNGGGIRFREAYNERIIKGVRFVDYKNYKPKNKDTNLNNISKAFENNNLELLSEIENKIENLEENEKC